MWGGELMAPWYASPYTGLFTVLRAVSPLPHDPDVAVWAGVVAPWGPRPQLPASGAGWDSAQAKAACVGEAIERLQPYPLPCDQSVEASWARWPLAEPAVEPHRWVLFHPEQYAQPGFPFAPFTDATVCRWTCFRQALTGEPCWVPEELAYLYPRPGEVHRICPAISTGLSCGRAGDPVLLRGLQEVIERDALVGAWWERYPLEEWPAGEVFATLDPALPHRLLRPNLAYRFYRIVSPFSAHVTMVTVEGQQREGFCIAVGSACRETRPLSWMKALLEAVQGIHYVRQLKKTSMGQTGVPEDFAQHAVFYSLHPELLPRTVLHRAARPADDTDAGRMEEMAALVERLGSERPVLFRNVTPPLVAQEGSGWHVLRILVPGVQPLHGSHHLPHLGGPLWSPRGLADLAGTLPHPFP
jgi:ribosomal protein S12 methylthiotransferase accessory factor